MYLCMYNQIIVHVHNQKFRLNKSTVDVIYSFHFLYYYYCHLHKNSGKSEKEMMHFHQHVKIPNMIIVNRYTEINKTILIILAKGFRQGFGMENFLIEIFQV